MGEAEEARAMADGIRRIELTHLVVPRKDLCRPGGGVAVAGRPKPAIFVEVETANGMVGRGECSPAFSEAIDDCWAALAGPIADGLLGAGFTEPQEIAAIAAAWPGGPEPRAAAESACWEILARERHESLAELLGARAERIDQGVEVGLSVGPCPTVVDLLRTAETHLAEGYRQLTVRIAPGADHEPLRAIRQHFGDLPLVADAAGLYGPGDLDALRRLDEWELTLLIQPLPADDLDGLAGLQAELATPIGLDATVADLDRAAAALARGVARAACLRAQRLGGLGATLELLGLCRRHDVACWVGNGPDLGLGQALGVHLAALDGCSYPADLGPPTRWFASGCESPRLELAGPGRFAVPTRPGLGYEPDPVELRRFAVRRESFSARSSG